MTRLFELQTTSYIGHNAFRDFCNKKSTLFRRFPIATATRHSSQ